MDKLSWLFNHFIVVNGSLCFTLPASMSVMIFRCLDECRKMMFELSFWPSLWRQNDLCVYVVNSRVLDIHHDPTHGWPLVFRCLSSQKPEACQILIKKNFHLAQICIRKDHLDDNLLASLSWNENNILLKTHKHWTNCQKNPHDYYTLLNYELCKIHDQAAAVTTKSWPAEYPKW